MSSRRDFVTSIGLPALVVFAGGFAWTVTRAGQPVQPPFVRGPVLERLDDPPMAPEEGVGAAAFVQFGAYRSVQVNVDALGNNVVNDAANEPSIGFDPNRQNRVVVGWRQFDNRSSNFREAGVNVSANSGLSWGAKQTLQNGIFRSDPVIEVDANGVFNYYSLDDTFLCATFRSVDGGISWTGPVAAFGGDKAWFVIDRFNSQGRNHYYASWSPNAGCCGSRVFSRSVDAGATWLNPVTLPRTPMFGTMDVGPDGEVYVFGIENNNFNSFVIAKSTNARDRNQTPSFTSTSVPMSGSMVFQPPINPVGLMGQANVAVDPSTARRGWVYALCSVNPSGTDPADVYFNRSTNGGSTWGTPRRLNLDGVVTSYQWFGQMAVAPNGRIDVFWYDTSVDGSNNFSQVVYTYSKDGGDTWVRPVVVSPRFNHTLGYPNQQKLGDYIDIQSDNEGPYLAYAATFNGEQDVYFLRIRLSIAGPGIRVTP